MIREAREGITSTEDTTVIYTEKELKMSEKEIWKEIRRIQREDIKPIADDVATIKGKMSVLSPILYLTIANFLAFIGILIAGLLTKSGG